MAIDNADAVDAVGIERDTGVVVLTIADSWDWQDERGHLTALHAKLNAYLNFIESGQIWESYPDSIGRQVVIDVVGRFCLPRSGVDLLNRASTIADTLHIKIRHRYEPSA